MSKPTNHYWTLSFLSSVAGQFSSQGMGDLGRHFAWAANDVSDYWLQYIVDETTGQEAVVIMSYCAPKAFPYSIIGYCNEHDIQCQLNEDMPEEDLQ